MNRKAESIGNMIAVMMARIRADLEAVHSLGKSLEAVTSTEYDTMGLEEWGSFKDIAQKAQDDSVTCLRAIGALPPFVPHPSASFAAGVVKTPEPPGKAGRPNAPRHRGDSLRKKGVSKVKGGSKNAATAPQEKGGTA